MENYILQYKNLSIKILELLNSEKIEDASKLLNDRNNILKKINDLYKENNSNISIKDKEEIQNVDNKISYSIEVKKRDIKEEMIKLKKEKSANFTYGKRFEDIFFINKQI